MYDAVSVRSVIEIRHCGMLKYRNMMSLSSDYFGIVRRRQIVGIK